MTINTEPLAQTYPQLINQLFAEKIAQTDILKIKIAFELALDFSDGIYRAQGVPLINHLIRTASILIQEKTADQCYYCCSDSRRFLSYINFDNGLRTSKLASKQKTITDKFDANIANMAYFISTITLV